MVAFLASALVAVPAAFRQHLKPLSAFLAAATMGAEATSGSARLRAVSSIALARLPRVAGDGVAWSGLAHRLLQSLHTVLDSALYGFEDAELVKAAKYAPCTTESCSSLQFRYSTPRAVSQPRISKLLTTSLSHEMHHNLLHQCLMLRIQDLIYLHTPKIIPSLVWEHSHSHAHTLRLSHSYSHAHSLIQGLKAPF